MSDQTNEVPEVPSDKELLAAVLSRLAPIAATIRSVRGLGLAIGVRLEADSDEYRDAAMLINQCTELLAYMEPLQNAAGIQAQYEPKQETAVNETVH